MSRGQSLVQDGLAVDLSGAAAFVGITKPLYLSLGLWNALEVQDGKASSFPQEVTGGGFWSRKTAANVVLLLDRLKAEADKRPGESRLSFRVPASSRGRPELLTITAHWDGQEILVRRSIEEAENG